MELMEHLLDLGLDTTLTDSPRIKDWPSPIFWPWYNKKHVSDPLYIQYQGMLLRDNQGKLQ